MEEAKSNNFVCETLMKLWNAHRHFANWPPLDFKIGPLFLERLLLPATNSCTSRKVTWWKSGAFGAWQPASLRSSRFSLSQLLGLFLASLSAVSATGFQWPRRRRSRGLSKMHLLFDCASKPGKEAGHFFMTRHRGYLLDIRYWYTLLASQQRQQGFCYCSTHRYRNIGGRFSASLLEKYKNSSACQLPRGFPHWKIEGFPDTATGWRKNRHSNTPLQAVRDSLRG